MPDKSYPTSVSEIEDTLFFNACFFSRTEPYFTLYESYESTNMYDSHCQIWWKVPGAEEGCTIHKITISYSQLPPYTFDELMDMFRMIESVEEKMVKLGIPFTSWYQFHGKNRADLARRNAENRLRLKDIIG